MMNGIRNSAQPDNDLVICRCEGVTLGQIKTCIHEFGARTVNQVKKLTRAGMGHCQGRTCAQTVERILEKDAAIPLGSEAYRSRPPTRNIPIATLAASADQYQEPAGPVSVAMLRTSGSNRTDLDPATEETD